MKTDIPYLVLLVLSLIQIQSINAQGFDKIGKLEVAGEDVFECPDSTFARLLEEANSKANKGEYEAALKKCYSAKVCKEDRDSVVNKQIDRIFQMILAERDRADSAFQKADKLVKAFYFYAGRFALAYGDKGEYGDNVFYFIDKNGDEVSKLRRWTKAEQFEWRGFAKVKKEESGQLTDYLLDTMGNIYRAAFDEKDLTENIQALDLSGKYLDVLPDILFRHTQLQVLLLRGNQLTRLPGEIGQLKNLTSLDLGGNQLTRLPDEIGQLKSLIWLDLSINQLTRLPSEIWQLENLTLLELSVNQLTRLPTEIGQLKKLTSLGLYRNQLTMLPAEIGQLKKLTTLYLIRNQLTRLPAEIGQLESLIWLDLSFNQLTSLPAEIGQLANLTSLGLSGNQLTSLPAEIGQLKNLTTLSLTDNQLKSLPAEIGQLKNLSTLYLNKNPISKPEQEKIKKLLPGCRIEF
jgi:Leucine-rich repeat (LRR) protein